MNIFNKFNKFESDVYNNEEDCLRGLMYTSVPWQTEVHTGRFHLKKNRGNFSFDDFSHIIHTVKDLIEADFGYEGIEKFPMIGASTTWNCKIHSSVARIEKAIGVYDFNNLYSCEVRLDTKDKSPYNYIWISSTDYGKRIKFNISLPRAKGQLIIDKYFTKQKGITLGDGFIR